MRLSPQCSIWLISPFLAPCPPLRTQLRRAYRVDLEGGSPARGEGTHGFLCLPQLLLWRGHTPSPLVLYRQIPVLRALQPLEDGPDHTAGHGRRAEEPLALAVHDEVLAEAAGLGSALLTPAFHPSLTQRVGPHHSQVLRGFSRGSPVPPPFLRS